MKLSEGCRETRNKLFETGWCQKRYFNDEGERCLKGAAVMVANENFLDLWQHMDDVAVQEGFTGTLDFNDTPGRRFSQIVEFTEKCEKAAEALESASDAGSAGLAVLEPGAEGLS